MHSIYASIIAFDDVDNYVAVQREFLHQANYRKNLQTFVFPVQLSHVNTVGPVLLS